jgi:hypothetical protein
MLDFNKLINYKFSIIFNEYTYNTRSDFFNDGQTVVPDFLAGGVDFVAAGESHTCTHSAII